MKANRIIDVTPEGQELLSQLHHLIDIVSGGAIEMLETSPTIILSPIMRRMLCDSSKELKALHLRLYNAMCLDWPQGDKDAQ